MSQLGEMLKIRYANVEYNPQEGKTFIIADVPLSDFYPQGHHLFTINGRYEKEDFVVKPTSINAAGVQVEETFLKLSGLDYQGLHVEE
jgi:hypothetical protein